MEDKRAHERIDNLEKMFTTHLQEQAKFEIALLENTIITKQIADNTRELVTLVKGIKGLRTFFIWATPVVATFIATWEWLKYHFK